MTQIQFEQDAAPNSAESAPQSLHPDMETFLTGTWQDGFSERERKEISFAMLYSQTYNHGTDGHNRLNVIAKMAHLLEDYDEKAAQATARVFPPHEPTESEVVIRALQVLVPNANASDALRGYQGNMLYVAATERVMAYRHVGPNTAREMLSAAIAMYRTLYSVHKNPSPSHSY